jgi:ketosteroid isomerase-like protein
MSTQNTTEQNKAIVRRAIEAMSRGDMDGFMAETADDIVFTPIGTVPGFSGKIEGKERMLKGLKIALAPRLEGGKIDMAIENLIADGDYVAEQAHGKARTKKGDDYNNMYCRVWKIVDGQVQSIVEYMDTELVKNVLAK